MLCATTVVVLLAGFIFILHFKYRLLRDLSDFIEFSSIMITHILLLYMQPNRTMMVKLILHGCSVTGFNTVLVCVSWWCCAMYTHSQV